MVPQRTTGSPNSQALRNPNAGLPEGLVWPHTPDAALFHFRATWIESELEGQWSVRLGSTVS